MTKKCFQSQTSKNTLSWQNKHSCIKQIVCENLAIIPSKCNNNIKVKLPHKKIPWPHTKLPKNLKIPWLFPDFKSTQKKIPCLFQVFQVACEPCVWIPPWWIKQILIYIKLVYIHLKLYCWPSDSRWYFAVSHVPNRSFTTFAPLPWRYQSFASTPTLVSFSAAGIFWRGFRSCFSV